MTKQDKYNESFGMGAIPDMKITENALQHALDIRKFEISLYWQRATYFWTLIAAAFAGYFAVLSAEHMSGKEFNAYVLACIGLIFSLAWFLTNRGSKYWQENWENHVDMLEDKVTGPLYKTVLHRPKAGNFVVRAIEGPAPFSVSQINQWVSLFIVAVWLYLIWIVIPTFEVKADLSMRHLVIGLITAVAVALMLFRAESSIGEAHEHSMSVRPTRIIEE